MNRCSMSIPHNHPLDGKLHDGCESCSFTMSRYKRDRAHKEVDNELQQLMETATKTKQKKDQ